MAGDCYCVSINTKPQDMENQDETTLLQKHVMFFDRNMDGIIYPSETYQGFRAIGVGVFLSAAAAVAINVGLSQITRPGKSIDLSFPIEVKNIHKAKHGSDSDVYDTEGRFVAAKFEEIFTKHARTHPNALTKDELKNFMRSNRDALDFIGWVAAFGEWMLVYILAKDEKGLLQKDTIRAAFDGTLFEQLAKKEAAKNKIKQNMTCDV